LRRIIGRPADECDLAPCSLARLELVLDVKHGVAAANALLALAVLALCVEQLLAEHVEVGLLGRLLDDNLLPVVADLVDDPLDVLAELELVERADALGRDGDTVCVSACMEADAFWECAGVRGREGAVAAVDSCKCPDVRRAVRTRIEPVMSVSAHVSWRVYGMLTIMSRV
jgi:hypothetical protein